MEYGGLDIKTNDKVYEPEEDSFLAADVVSQEIEGMRGELSILDMGCGTGIVGLIAATKENVNKVTFADISDEALDLCKTNFQGNRDMIHAECDFVKSDLFTSVEGMFDLIVFNAPYLPEGKEDKLSNAWYGGETGIAVATKFLKQALDHMKDHSEIVIIVSSLGDLEKLEQEVTMMGLAVDKQQKAQMDFEDIVAMVLTKHYIADVS